MGITINRPTEMRLGQILEQMDLEIKNPDVDELPVYNGGPVQIDRGFILHEQAYNWDSTVQVSDDISLTTSKDVLESIASGEGPEKFLVALGYAGWSSGQLENEIIQNAWLNGPANSEIIFNTAFEKRWEAAASSMGINIDQISTDFGHA